MSVWLEGPLFLKVIVIVSPFAKVIASALNEKSWAVMVSCVRVPLLVGEPDEEAPVVVAAGVDALDVPYVPPPSQAALASVSRRPPAASTIGVRYTRIVSPTHLPRALELNKIRCNVCDGCIRLQAPKDCCRLALPHVEQPVGLHWASASFLAC